MPYLATVNCMSTNLAAEAVTQFEAQAATKTPAQTETVTKPILKDIKAIEAYDDARVVGKALFAASDHIDNTNPVSLLDLRHSRFNVAKVKQELQHEDLDQVVRQADIAHAREASMQTYLVAMKQVSSRDFDRRATYFLDHGDPARFGPLLKLFKAVDNGKAFYDAQDNGAQLVAKQAIVRELFPNSSLTDKQKLDHFSSELGIGQRKVVKLKDAFDERYKFNKDYQRAKQEEEANPKTKDVRTVRKILKAFARPSNGLRSGNAGLTAVPTSAGTT